MGKRTRRSSLVVVDRAIQSLEERKKEIRERYFEKTTKLLEQKIRTVYDSNDAEAIETLYKLARHINSTSNDGLVEILNIIEPPMRKSSSQACASKEATKSKYDEFVRRMEGSRTKDADRILDNMGLKGKSRGGIKGTYSRYHGSPD